jgi:hypothetical protein
MITASNACRRDFLLPRQRRDACCHCPPLVFGDALVMEEENLDWQRFEG